MGSLVYYTNREGLWGSPEQTISFYYGLRKKAPEPETIIPKEVSDKILATAKKASDTSELSASFVVTYYLNFSHKQVAVWSDPNYVPLADRWNNAVSKSANFLILLPDYVSKWTNLSSSKD